MPVQALQNTQTEIHLKLKLLLYKTEYFVCIYLVESVSEFLLYSIFYNIYHLTVTMGTVNRL